MSFKVRLYKGQFSGQVREMPSVAGSKVKFVGAKRMTRQARYEYMYDNYSPIYGIKQLPRVEAVYEVCYDPNGYAMRHPDGSVFMEWTGVKSEY